MATTSGLSTATSRKNLCTKWNYSVAVPAPNSCMESLGGARVCSSPKTPNSDSAVNSNSSSSTLGSSHPLPLQPGKQSSNEELSSFSYATAPDHGHKAAAQDQSPKKELKSSLNKSSKSIETHSIAMGSSDPHSKMVDAAPLEQPLKEAASEYPVSVSVLNELPETYLKHAIDDSNTCNSNCLSNPSDFVSGFCKEVSGQCNGQFASQPSICHYQSPDSFYSGTQYTEAKDSFGTTEVSDCASIVDNSCGSAKVSNSCDFVESSKTSICRGSTGSDISDESSSSGFSGAVNKPHKANDTRWEAVQVIRSRDGMLGFNHFRLLRRLGSGDIGSVYLAELSGTRCYFAMKVMDKEALANRKKLPRAQTEREILQSLDHPFLPTLYTHFETEKFSCLVMEFCSGGDLHALRQRQPGKHFPEHAARFYLAEVLLALEYLHMLGIIYRDLKPENVLVREDGHIMLSDFDLSLRCTVCPTLVKSSNTNKDFSEKNSAYCAQPACIEPTCVVPPSCMQPTCFVPRFLSSKSKKVKKAKPKNEVYKQVNLLPELIAEPTSARSMSFVGTHEYLAPEIIKGEGHGSAVDWWTFGIFLYELLFGMTPFKGSGNRDTLFNVVGQPLRFPESPTVSFAARDLIRGLLVKEPQHRLAYRRGATEIKQHPFFQSVNWALIRCTNPPGVPKPLMMDFSAITKMPKAAKNENVLGVDVKPSGNYLEIDFF